MCIRDSRKPRTVGAVIEGGQLVLNLVAGPVLIPADAAGIVVGQHSRPHEVRMRGVVTVIRQRLEMCIRDRSMGGYQVQKEGYWQDYQNQQLTMISLVLGGIAAISLLVGGIGIMNIMLVTVTERTREIGIRRSIGAQRSSIVAPFLIESGMLCGMGGIVGIIFGTIGSLALGKILFQMTIFPATWVTLAAFGLSVALGVLFGSYPAAKASKLQPVEALRAD